LGGGGGGDGSGGEAEAAGTTAEKGRVAEQEPAQRTSWWGILQAELEVEVESPMLSSARAGERWELELAGRARVKAIFPYVIGSPMILIGDERSATVLTHFTR
jgi:hypothetical protein